MIDRMSRHRIGSLLLAALILPLAGCGLFLSGHEPYPHVKKAQPTLATLPEAPDRGVVVQTTLFGATTTTAPTGVPGITPTTSRPRNPTAAASPPEWCGLVGCPGLKGQIVPPAPPAQTDTVCQAAARVVQSGYALFGIRQQTSVERIKAALLDAVSALDAFAIASGDPDLQSALDRSGEKLTNLAQFDGRPVAELLDYVLPAANEISLVIQRVLNRQTCPGL
jgi:hypothetical protein